MGDQARVLVRRIEDAEDVVHSACGTSVRIITRADTDVANLHVTTIHDAQRHYHERCTERKMVSDEVVSKPLALGLG